MKETMFFMNKKVIWEQLIPYGFVKIKGIYHLSTDILDGQFRLVVSILEDGSIETKVIDAVSNEEYVLHRVVDAVGSFTVLVREAYKKAMFDIAEKCFEMDIFKSVQAKKVIDYVNKIYGNKLEFLWEKFPKNAIFRRQDNQKWYAALLTVSKSKLGLEGDAPVEILDLRIQPEKLTELLDGKTYFLGYHMNKKNWYTILLNGSVPTDEILQRIDNSFMIAGKK